MFLYINVNDKTHTDPCLQQIKPKLIKQVVQIKNDTNSWISKMQNALSNLEPDTDESLVIFAEKEPTSGILGFFNCLKEEQKRSNIRYL